MVISKVLISLFFYFWSWFHNNILQCIGHIHNLRGCMVAPFIPVTCLLQILFYYLETWVGVQLSRSRRVAACIVRTSKLVPRDLRCNFATYAMITSGICSQFHFSRVAWVTRSSSMHCYRTARRYFLTIATYVFKISNI